LFLNAAALLVQVTSVSQAPAEPPEARPPWLSLLPQVPGRLYGLGVADLRGPEADARIRAAERARLEVVTRLRATVKGETAVLTQTHETRSGGLSQGTGERTTREELQVGARAEDLPGLAVERFHVDPASRVVYALAYLDIAQAREALGASLEVARNGRLRIGSEASRKARFRLRGLRGELGRLEGLSGLLASAGLLGDFPAQLQAERKLLEERLIKLEAAELPPIDLASSSLALRTNTDLPGGIQDYLEARIKTQGPAYRSAGADFTLDLVFSGGSKGPEFIYSEMTFAVGVLYHLEVRLRILDASGVDLTRATVISLTQAGSPEGLVEQFRRQFDRRLPRLLDELMSELK